MGTGDVAEGQRGPPDCLGLGLGELLLSGDGWPVLLNGKALKRIIGAAELPLPLGPGKDGTRGGQPDILDGFRGPPLSRHFVNPPLRGVVVQGDRGQPLGLQPSVQRGEHDTLPGYGRRLDFSVPAVGFEQLDR
jgi:hypothetical protein